LVTTESIVLSEQVYFLMYEKAGALVPPTDAIAGAAAIAAMNAASAAEAAQKRLANMAATDLQLCKMLKQPSSLRLPAAVFVKPMARMERKRLRRSARRAPPGSGSRRHAMDPKPGRLYGSSLEPCIQGHIPQPRSRAQ